MHKSDYDNIQLCILRSHFNLEIKLWKFEKLVDDQFLASECAENWLLFLMLDNLATINETLYSGKAAKLQLYLARSKYICTKNIDVYEDMCLNYNC